MIFRLGQALRDLPGFVTLLLCLFRTEVVLQAPSFWLLASGLSAAFLAGTRVLAAWCEQERSACSTWTLSAGSVGPGAQGLRAVAGEGQSKWSFPFLSCEEAEAEAKAPGHLARGVALRQRMRTRMSLSYYEEAKKQLRPNAHQAMYVSAFCIWPVLILLVPSFLHPGT